MQFLYIRQVDEQCYSAEQKASYARKKKRNKGVYSKKSHKKHVKDFTCFIHRPHETEEVTFSYHQVSESFGDSLPRPPYDNTESYIDYLRRYPTRSEKVAVDFFTKNKLNFVFQYKIGSIITDFYFPDLNLILELDGKFHKNRKDKDSKRNDFLKLQGYTVVRVPSYLVFVNVQCLLTLLNKVKTGL